MKRNLTYIPNVNVKAEEQVESLRRLVAKKKANDEKIPWELLQTQYKNPYDLIETQTDRPVTVSSWYF